MKTLNIVACLVVSSLLMSCAQSGSSKLEVKPQIAVAPATADLKLEQRESCGFGGGKKQYIVNANKNQRIIANVLVASTVPSFSYLTFSHANATYQYPRPASSVLLAAGDTGVMVGCTVLQIGGLNVPQQFSIEGAYYPSEDPTPITKDDPSKFVIFTEQRSTSCDKFGQGGKAVRIQSIHPSKQIEVVYTSNNGRVDQAKVVLEPQGNRSDVGCISLQGQPFVWHGIKAIFI